MNETSINEDYKMDANPLMMGTFKSGLTHSTQILTIINTNDGLMHEIIYLTILLKMSNFSTFKAHWI